MLPTSNPPEQTLLGSGSAQSVQADNIQSTAFDFLDAAAQNDRNWSTSGSTLGFARHYRFQIGTE